MPKYPLAIAAVLLACSAGGASAAEVLWRKVEPENLVFMELPAGTVAIEINSAFAPATAQQFRELVQERFYDGLGFYRVIEGFVAQGGDGSDLGELSDKATIKAEFEREWSEELSWQFVQQPDLFAPLTGFVDGFAVSRDPESNQAWLAHCPGAVAMARNNDKDSSRTDFYIVIGQAPRYLDRNMNVFGRVIDGMHAVQAIQRGPESNNGIFQDETRITRIRRMRLASDIPEEERLEAYVMDTQSEAFEEMLDSRRHRRQAFFHRRPPAVLDLCQVPVSGRVTK